MGWHLLESLLQQVGEHATLVGKLWVTATFVFRFVIVACVGDAVYSDEQSDFKCNTETPGCGNICFNTFSPISHLRFWAAQIIAVCTPSIVFIVYATHVLMKSQNDQEIGEDEQDQDRLLIEEPTSVEVNGGPPPPRTRRSSKRKPSTKSVNNTPRKRAPSERNRPNTEFAISPTENDGGMYPTEFKPIIPQGAGPDGQLKDKDMDVDKSLADIERQLAALERQERKHSSKANKRIKFAYVIALFLRTGSEGVFIWLQYVLYGFSVPEIYYCQRKPCPHVVDCFVSRPMEKTLFLWFMFVVSCICLALNIVEIKYLGLKKLVKILFSSSSLSRRGTPYSTASKMSNGDSATFNSNTNLKTPDSQPNYNNRRDHDGRRMRSDSDEYSIGFDDIGKPPSYPLSRYPLVHTYGVLLRTTPTAPISAEVEKSYL